MMPMAPTRNALRCCFGYSERQASAMTTALSPLNTTLITAILNNAVHMSGSDKMALMGRGLWL